MTKICHKRAVLITKPSSLFTAIKASLGKTKEARCLQQTCKIPWPVSAHEIQDQESLLSSSVCVLVQYLLTCTPGTLLLQVLRAPALLFLPPPPLRSLSLLSLVLRCPDVSTHCLRDSPEFLFWPNQFLESNTVHPPTAVLWSQRSKLKHTFSS